MKKTEQSANEACDHEALLIAIHDGTAPGLQEAIRRELQRLDEELPPGLPPEILAERCTC